MIFFLIHEGCVTSVEINGRVQDLSRIQKQNKVVPGCGGGQQHDEAQGPAQALSTLGTAESKLTTHSEIQTLARSSILNLENNRVDGEIIKLVQSLAITRCGLSPTTDQVNFLCITVTGNEITYMNIAVHICLKRMIIYVILP